MTLRATINVSRPSTDPDTKSLIDNVYALLKKHGQAMNMRTLETIISGMKWTDNPDAIASLTRDRSDMFIRRPGRMIDLRERHPEVSPRIFSAPDTPTIRSHSALLMYRMRSRRAAVRTLLQMLVDRGIFETDSRYAYERIWKALDERPEIFRKVGRGDFQLIDTEDKPCTAPAHEWKLDTPVGPISVGQCKRCHRFKLFANSNESITEMAGDVRSFNGRLKQ